MPRMARQPQKLTDRIKSEWETATGLTPEVHTVCEPEIVKALAESIEQGAPLSVALDLHGVPEDTFREWKRRAQRDEAPYNWAITLITKAQASYIFTNIVELNLAEGAVYKKYLEILRLRNGNEWGGEGMTMSDEEFSAEFL